MNSYGRVFRIHIYGESHANNVGIIIDGCPPGIPISLADFNRELKRRKAGAKGTTKRIESDKPIIESGIFKGNTTGAPISIRFENNNQLSKDYNKFLDLPRPGHADFTTRVKYGGYNDYRGGGHFSGRLTIGLVAAGVIAKKIIKPFNIESKLISVGNSYDIKKTIAQTLESGDSIGGLIECRITGIPVGLGEPYFYGCQSAISSIIFSIPAINGIEFGKGFEAQDMKGSEFNDPIIDEIGTTLTNNAGGINGGITNGNPIIFSVSVKPPSSISRHQKTYNFKKKKMDSLVVNGRHDACIALRMPVIIESAATIALADLILLNSSITVAQ